MTFLTNTHRPTRFGWPRLAWRRALGALVALDRLHRERADLAALDDRALRDIGVTRHDVEAALGRPEEHLRLILLRCGH